MRAKVTKWIDRQTYSTAERGRLSFPLLDHDAQSHMFIEDCYQVLFPDHKTVFRLDGGSDVELRIAGLLRSEHHARDLDRELYKYLQDVVRNLVTYGIAVFEPWDESVFESYQPRLGKVIPFTLVENRSKLSQMIPAVASPNGKTNFVPLSDEVYVCKLLKDFETRRAKLLTGLRITSMEHSFPKFIFENENAPVDLGLHRELLPIGTGQLGKETGWIGRWGLSKETYAYYRISKALQFLMFKTQVRDIAIGFLESCISTELKGEGRIHIERTPSVDLIKALQERLKIGEVWVAGIEEETKLPLRY